MIALRACSVMLALLGAWSAGAEPLEIGSPAPAFTLLGSDGRDHALAELLGKRGLVLAWFPRAFTPG